MRRTIFSLGAALVLTCQSAAAQDEMSQDEVLAELASVFTAEPLTAEQEARLPLAREVVSRILPEGAMMEMMDKMMGGIFGPMMDLDLDADADKVSAQLGLYSPDLSMTEEEAAEALTILDPSWRERQAIERDIFPAILSEMMTKMEPVMRQAMGELYAVHFTDIELAGINAFFQTDIGAAYARKSFTLASDPRLMATTMEAMPDMMGMFEGIDQRMATATEGLSEPRAFDELDGTQQARLAELTGLSVEVLAEGWDIGVEVIEDEAPEDEAIDPAM
ncbi:MAG: DUF2059 domain-containing protein [Pontixanthobacter sp.]